MNLLTKEDVITAIKELAARAGRTPTYPEMRRAIKISERQIEHLFGCYTKALKECGLEPLRRNAPVTMKVLFRQWAGVVRKLGRLPTANEYEFHAQRSPHVLRRRCVSWKNVPLVMKRFGDEMELWQEWEDVREVIETAEAKERAITALREAQGNEEDWKISGAPTYGEPIISPALAHAPTNEAGVLVLFGSLAAELGYLILHMQTGFPDCVALRRIGGDRCQLTKIELEYESRNFREHKHDPQGCDLIVCWNHNWPECPVRVLELKKFVTQR